MQKSEPQKHHQQQASKESDDSEQEEEEEEEEEEENSFNFDSQSSTSSSDAYLQNPNSSRINNFRIEPIIPNRPNTENRRKTSVSLPSDEPRYAISRVWTEEDEIVVLKGMLNFAKKGKSPYEDAIGFLECYGDTLSFEPRVGQLKFKMRRLKARFDFMSRGAVGDDEDPVLEKPHDLWVYGLGKKIWGRKDGKFAEIVGIDVRKKKKKTKKDFEDECYDDLGHEKKNLRFKVNRAGGCVFPCLDDLMKLEIRDYSKEKEVTAGLIEKKRKLEVSDVKAYLKWIDLVRERALKVLEVIESADSLEFFKR